MGDNNISLARQTQMEEPSSFLPQPSSPQNYGEQIAFDEIALSFVFIIRSFGSRQKPSLILVVLLFLH
jgi:hypothetical protein